MSRWWGTLSKAFWKSKMRTSICRPWSRFLAKSSTVIKSWESQEWFDRNPCWNEDKIWYCSRWFMICLNITCSNSLQVYLIWFPVINSISNNTVKSQRSYKTCQVVYEANQSCVEYFLFINSNKYFPYRRGATSASFVFLDEFGWIE